MQPADQLNDSRNRAVVLGAGMAGLLAAAALSKHFSQVVVVERDPAPAPDAPRKGTPQAAHIHLLLIRGAQIIESLVPGVFDDLSANGGLTADSTRDLAFHLFGAWQPRGHSGLPARLQTRPFLEFHVSRRLAAVPNVRILHQHEARDVVIDAGGVTGVHLASKHDGSELAVNANVVIDATGRASPTPRWLAQHGYPVPSETEVGLKITYASRLFSRPNSWDSEDWRAMLIYPRPPKEYRGGALYFQENQRLIVTMASYRGETPPVDDSTFLEFARSLPSPEIYRLIRDAQPASPVSVYRYPGALRRRYERLAPRLRGLLPLGDSVCSFNPVFGQGITAAALQAQALSECIDEGGLDDLERRFAQRAARACDTPWLLSTTMDFRYPHTDGHRPVWQSIADAYLDKFFRATSTDYGSLVDFMQVLHMLASPARITHPRNLLAILRAAVGRRHLERDPRPALATYSLDGQRT